MRINHGRTHILVPHQLLNCPDIITAFQQMCSKRMTECMTTDPFGQICFSNGNPDCFLVLYRNLLQTKNATARLDADAVALDSHGDVPLMFSPLKMSSVVDTSSMASCQIKQRKTAVRAL